jgi:hypothetical protein
MNLSAARQVAAPASCFYHPATDAMILAASVFLALSYLVFFAVTCGLSPNLAMLLSWTGARQSVAARPRYITNVADTGGGYAQAMSGERRSGNCLVRPCPGRRGARASSRDYPLISLTQATARAAAA